MPQRMFLETVRSEGLAHLSYIVGHAGQAAVIDPRRDSSIYQQIAERHGAAITRIFETHRNEDYVIGSRDLARRTGATIHHGARLDFSYGQSVCEGNTFDIGQLRLGVLETPGHTHESISLTLADATNGPDPVGVFTGDALFIGDVGRTDLLPEGAEHAAGLLYESLHRTLGPLGDGVIVYPAHGAGSVCGMHMAPREFSTLGYERQHNHALQLDRDAFIRHKAGEYHDQPPYFKRMEQYNQFGPPELTDIPHPCPLDPSAFAETMDEGLFVVDLREPEAFAGAFVPGSLCIPLEMLASYGGWFLPYDRPLGLVAESSDQVGQAVRHLLRIGYDDVAGYLSGGLGAWETSGRPFGRVRTLPATELRSRLESGEDFTLLDVRKPNEVAEQRLKGSLHIHLGELPGRLDEIPRDRPVTTLCSSGRRAMIAASILKKHGFEQVENNLGSMQACLAVGCPTET